MTPREKLLATYRGDFSGGIPALADLSWWEAAHGGGKFIPGYTGDANTTRVPRLMELHRATGALIHLNLGCFYRVSYDVEVEVSAGIRGEEYFHRFDTPVGTVEEIREWSPVTWSWPIIHHMVQTLEDLKVIRYVYERIRYETDWNALAAANEAVGDLGLPLVQAPYTGLGFLLSRYAGAERTVYFWMDEPAELEATIATINRANAEVFRQLVAGPSEVLFLNDNLSSDLQSPALFGQFSRDHYAAMAQSAHAANKPLVAHLDGRLHGLLEILAAIGVDGADAVTPAPMGDLSPAACRVETGPRFILSGGVPPSSFNARVPLNDFDAQVYAWLEQGPAVVVAPGDQLPPDGELDRVKRMVEITAGYCAG